MPVRVAVWLDREEEADWKVVGLAPQAEGVSPNALPKDLGALENVLWVRKAGKGVKLELGEGLYEIRLGEKNAGEVPPGCGLPAPTVMGGAEEVTVHEMRAFGDSCLAYIEHQTKPVDGLGGAGGAGPTLVVGEGGSSGEAGLGAQQSGAPSALQVCSGASLPIAVGDHLRLQGQLLERHPAESPFGFRRLLEVRRERRAFPVLECPQVRAPCGGIFQRAIGDVRSPSIPEQRVIPEGAVVTVVSRPECNDPLTTVGPTAYYRLEYDP